jgi:hypothetical protein
MLISFLLKNTNVLKEYIIYFKTFSTISLTTKVVSICKELLVGNVQPRIFPFKNRKPDIIYLKSTLKIHNVFKLFNSSLSTPTL